MGSVFQMLRNGFPDSRFFGNTWVAYNLALFDKEDRERIVSARSPNLVPGANQHSKKFAEDMWKRRSDADIDYIDYMTPAGFEQLKQEIWTALDRDQPVIINYHFPEAELPAGIPRKLRAKFGDNVVQVAHLHCMREFLDRNKSWGTERSATTLLDHLESGTLDGCVAVSGAVRDSFSMLPRDRVTMILNGVDPEVYRIHGKDEINETLDNTGIVGRKIIGYSGRLEEAKGFPDLMKTIGWFNDHPEFNYGFLIAATSGGHREHLGRRLREIAPRLLKEGRVGVVLDLAKFSAGGIDDAIRKYFESTGTMEWAQRAGLYRGAIGIPLQSIVDVYFHPSNTEALGLSMVEAALCGTPVVSQRVDGVPEVVEKAVGIRVEPHLSPVAKIRAYADAIIATSKKRVPYARKENVRNDLLTVFDAKAMSERTTEFYNDLVHENMIRSINRDYQK